MNIQIFGTKKSSDTKKAERYFKERGVKVQFIDLKEKGMSKGEFASVKQAVGGLDNLINNNSKDKDLLALFNYLSESDSPLWKYLYKGNRRGQTQPGYPSRHRRGQHPEYDSGCSGRLCKARGSSWRGHRYPSW